MNTTQETSHHKNDLRRISYPIGALAGALVGKFQGPHIEHLLGANGMSWAIGTAAAAVLAVSLPWDRH